MRFAVSETRFSPPLPAPVTYDRWMQITHDMDTCLEARNIQWLYSLVSVTGDRSVCVFQVPYVEAVREAYREARMQFHRIWQSTVVPSIPNAGADTVLVLEVEGDPSLNPKSYLENQPLAILTNDTRSLTVFATTNANAEAMAPLLNAQLPNPHEPNSSNCIWQATLIRPHS
jgi:hypothetical protein